MMPATLVVALLVVTGCNVVTSDEERVARAEGQMSAGEFRGAMSELKKVLEDSPDNRRARELLAEVSLSLGDVAAADKEIQRAVDLGASAAETGSLRLQILLAKGDFEDVLTTLGRQSGGLTPAEIFNFSGKALLGLGQGEAALANYREWQLADPESVAAATGIAAAQAAIGNSEQALRALEALVQEVPDDVDAQFLLGRLLADSASLNRAELAYRTAANMSVSQANVTRHAMILAALAETQLALGKLDDASASVERLADIAPLAPKLVFLQAQLSRMQGDYARSARLLQGLLIVDPENNLARSNLAHAQMMQGNFSQAHSLLGRVVATSPDNTDAGKLFAELQRRRSQPNSTNDVPGLLINGSGAINDPELFALLASASLHPVALPESGTSHRQAAVLAPSVLQARYDLAKIYLRTRQTGLALEVLDSIPADDDVTFRGEHLRMLTLHQAGREDDADAIADRLRARQPSSAAAVSQVADYLLRTDRLTAAASHLQHYLEQGDARDAARADIQNSLALIDWHRGDTNSAERRYSAVLAIDSTNLSALTGLARIEIARGNLSRGIDYLGSAALAHSRALAPRVELTKLLLSTGQVSEAEQVAGQIQKIGFEEAGIHELLGTVFSAAERYEDAIDQFAAAARSDPASADAQLSMARANLSFDRTVAAREASEQALKLRPDWPEALRVLAAIERAQGRLDEARKRMREVRALNSASQGGTTFEGELARFQRRYRAAAIDQSAQIVVAGSEDPAVLSNLARLHQQNGNLESAVEYAELAYRMAPESASVADTLGWIYRDLGRLDKSLHVLSDARRLSPDNGEIGFHLATVMSDSGDTGGARAVLQQLLARDLRFPSKPDAEAMLRAL